MDDPDTTLVLFRPSPNSNVYIVDEHEGTIYGVTRGKATAGLLWSLAHHSLRRGSLKPLPYTKKLLEVERRYRACSNEPQGYVRTVLGWQGNPEIQLGWRSQPSASDASHRKLGYNLEQRSCSSASSPSDCK